jgi:hypothetical protein
MKKKIAIIALLVVVAIIFMDTDVMGQCAMCKKNLESNLKSGGTVGKSINNGILYLMAIPYLLLGSIVYVFFRKQIAEKISSFRKK